MAQAILSLYSQGPHVPRCHNNLFLLPPHPFLFFLLPFLLSGSPPHSPLFAPVHPFFFSRFLHTLLLTEIGISRASNENLLRSRWYVPGVSPVGVGHPTVRRLVTSSSRIWCGPTWQLEVPDIGPAVYAIHASNLILVRSGHRQTVPFSYVAKSPATPVRPAVGLPDNRSRRKQPTSLLEGPSLQ